MSFILYLYISKEYMNKELQYTMDENKVLGLLHLNEKKRGTQTLQEAIRGGGNGDSV